MNEDTPRVASLGEIVALKSNFKPGNRTSKSQINQHQMCKRVRKIVRHFESHKTKIRKNYHVPGTSQVPDFSPD